MKITVIGPGRAGTAIYQHAQQAGFQCTLTRAYTGGADVVVIAVPDAAVSGIAASIEEGPIVGTLSGTVPLEDLAPHVHRFVLHPMQTILPNQDDLQLAGCVAGITASDAAVASTITEFARALGMEPVLIPEHLRPLPHIACVFASNLLLAPLLSAMQVLEAAGLGADRRHLLEPLIHRTIENALKAGTSTQPTGPVARGDRATVAAHRKYLQAIDPALAESYALLSTALLPHVAAEAAAAVRPALEPIT